MDQPFIGTIALFGFGFTPRGWAPCNGQLLDISSNTALFSLLGTTYGGNGQTNFALPDLQGRVAIAYGTGGGQGPRMMGEQGGAGTVTLTTQQLPAHSHGLKAGNSSGNSNDPTGRVLADPGRGNNSFTDAAANVDMNSSAIGNTGSNEPVRTMPPYLVLNYCIAVEGIYPSRQ